jgi:uncharacterized alkaline shock family protein YloU
LTAPDSPAVDGPELPDPAVEKLLVPGAPATAVLALEPDDLDGYSIDNLSDYLDAGMEPQDPVIEVSPSCQIALAALRRLKALTKTFLEDEAAAEGPTDEMWVSSLIRNITLESRAGRQIPYRSANARAELTITEGAVRGIVRAAGDTVHGILVGRSHLTGDVTILDEPITIEVEASVIWRHNIPDAADQLRDVIQDALTLNTELNIAGITITISDVHITHMRPGPGPEETP